MTGGSALHNLTAQTDVFVLTDAPDVFVLQPFLKGGSRLDDATDLSPARGPPPTALSPHGCPVGIVLLLN